MIKKINFIILSISVLFLMILIKCCYIEYQDSDDYVISAIISGIYSGEPSAQTVFQGYFLSSFTAALYRYIPLQIEWYAVNMHTLYLLSYVVIAWCILQCKFEAVTKYLLYIAFLSLQSYLIISPQFTIIAGEIGLASALLLIGHPNKKRYLLSAILFFLGSQLRLSALLLSYMLVSPILFLPIRFHKKDYWVKIGILFSIFCISVGIDKISNSLNYQGADWEYYTAFNRQRGELFDHPYRLDGEQLLQDSIKKTEYIELLNFRLADGKILTIEELEECKKKVFSKRSEVLKNNLLPYIEGYKAHGLYLLVVWYFLLFAAALKQRNKGELLVLSFTILMFIAANIFCMNMSRVKERIIIDIAMSMFAVACISTLRLIAKKKILHFLSLLVAIVFVYQYFSSSQKLLKKQDWHQEVMTEINDLLLSIPDTKVHDISLPIYCDIYQARKCIYLQKFIGNGWLINLPLHKQYYTGYPSLLNLPIIINKKREPAISVIEHTLKHHYGISVERHLVAESNDYIIVRLIEIPQADQASSISRK